MPAARVVVLDQKVALSDEIASVIAEVPGAEVVAMATSPEQARQLVEFCHPDLLVVGAALAPAADGAFVEALGPTLERPLVVIVTTCEERHEARSARLSLREPSGSDPQASDLAISPALLRTLLDHSQPEAPKVVESHHPAFTNLTARERQILALLVEGLGLRAIALELRLALNTVRTHTRNIQMKLNVHSNAEAVTLAREPGFLVGSAFRRA